MMPIDEALRLTPGRGLPDGVEVPDKVLRWFLAVEAPSFAWDWVSLFSLFRFFPKEGFLEPKRPCPTTCLCGLW
jgi:hypothetical protein